MRMCFLSLCLGDQILCECMSFRENTKVHVAISYRWLIYMIFVIISCRGGGRGGAGGAVASPNLTSFEPYYNNN